MEQNLYDILGKTLKEYRLQQGWSQEEMGDKAGFHPSYIGQIERNKKKVSLLTVQKLAHALKVNVSDLLQENFFDTQLSGWENKILKLIHERPDHEQECAYKILKEALPLSPFSKK